MRRLFEDTKTIIVESVGVIGGFIGARSSDWDYEPLILTIVSFIGLSVSVVSILLNDDRTKPEMSTHPDSGITGMTKKPVMDNVSKIRNLVQVPFTNILPNTIKEQVTKAPLFQQKDVAQNFVGLSIQWKLNLFMIHKSTGSKVVVTMKPNTVGYQNINFETDVNNYPILKIAQDGKEFLVSGIIVKCSSYGIELELTDLQEL
ncbi:MAG: hypothetical protein JWR44_939 [Hymenobacter sp.]|jgi:hypothetical protein|nr:hypothetical protein [Hymenobacter sp.]